MRRQRCRRQDAAAGATRSNRDWHLLPAQEMPQRVEIGRFAFTDFVVRRRRMGEERVQPVEQNFAPRQPDVGRALTVNEAKPKESFGGGRSFNSPNRRPGAVQSRY